MRVALGIGASVRENDRLDTGYDSDRRGHRVEDLASRCVAPWERMGALDSFVDLKVSGHPLTDRAGLRSMQAPMRENFCAASTRRRDFQ